MSGDPRPPENFQDLDPASKCPTPKKFTSTDLPIVDDELDAVEPLDFQVAGGLVNFQSGLEETKAEDLSEYTDAQLYEMNQQLLKDSVPVRPLIDAVSPMSSLREEYENGSATFLKQIDWLRAHGFQSIRRTRGDGDCFYRCEPRTALGFAYVEKLLESSDTDMAVAQSLSSLTAIKPILEQGGIESLVYEDFFEEFESLIENVVKPDHEGRKLTPQGLLNAFQMPEVSNAIVMFLRLLTSAQIRVNREAYDGFLVHPDTREPMDVESYCANVVQTMGKEADNVEMDALCRALQLNVDVAYLNGGRDDCVDFITFRNASDGDGPLVLLYRPGHYDILAATV